MSAKLQKTNSTITLKITQFILTLFSVLFLSSCDSWPYGIPYGIFHGGTAHAADSWLNAVVKADLSSGSRSTSSKSGTRGTGPTFDYPIGIAFYKGATYAADHNLDAVVKVDLSSGNRTYVSKSGTRGTGPAFGDPRGIAFLDGAAYIADGGYRGGLRAIVKVDLSSGDRTIISRSETWRTELNRGTGPAFGDPRGIAFLDGTAYVTDSWIDAVVKVDLSSGDRTIISRNETWNTELNRGTGPAFGDPIGIAFQSGSAYVADHNLDAVVKVDLSSGNRTYISKSGTRGTGPAFISPNGIAFQKGSAYVTDSGSEGGLRAVVKVDLSSGDRTIISRNETWSTELNRGTGPAFSPRGIVFRGGAVYVTDSWLDAVVKVDPSSGDRIIFSK